jgi:hypothetical protein
MLHAVYALKAMQPCAVRAAGPEQPATRHGRYVRMCNARAHSPDRCTCGNTGYRETLRTCTDDFLRACDEFHHTMPIFIVSCNTMHMDINYYQYVHMRYLNVKLHYGCTLEDIACRLLRAVLVVQRHAIACHMQFMGEAAL